MQLLATHLAILRRAAGDGFPPVWHFAEGDREADIVLELRGAGLLHWANRDPRLGLGYGFIDCKITLAGREYLARLEEEALQKSRRGRVAAGGRKLRAWMLVGIGAVAMKAIDKLTDWALNHLFK